MNNIAVEHIFLEVVMNLNGFNKFEDFIKYCGYNGDDNSSKADQSKSNDTEGCNDIPGGFQDLNPQLFTVIGELLGCVMAGNMPFNIQNAVGNWFELLGQVILTCNAQQQYFQSGPGRYYNTNNKNVNNSFCASNSNSSSSGELEDLKRSLGDLMREVKELKKEINKLKNDK